MISDRRQHDRIDCYMIALQSKKHPEEDDFFGEVRNVSSGGALIETDYNLTVGRQLELTFIHEDRSQIWHGQGKVVWIKNNNEQIQFGLEFITVFEEKLTELIKTEE